MGKNTVAKSDPSDVPQPHADRKRNLCTHCFMGSRTSSTVHPTTSSPAFQGAAKPPQNVPDECDDGPPPAPHSIAHLLWQLRDNETETSRLRRRRKLHKQQQQNDEIARSSAGISESQCAAGVSSQTWARNRAKSCTASRCTSRSESSHAHDAEQELPSPTPSDPHSIAHLIWQLTETEADAKQRRRRRKLRKQREKARRLSLRENSSESSCEGTIEASAQGSDIP